MRLSKIPAATSTAKPAARGFGFSGTSGGVGSAVIDYGRQAYCGIRAETARYHTATVPNHGLIRIAGAGPSGLAAAIILARAGRQVEVHEAKGDVGTRFIGDLQIIEGASESEPVPAFLDRLGIERNFYFRAADWATFYDHKENARVIRSKEPYGWFIHRGAEEGTLDRGLLAQAQRAGAKVIFNSRLSAEQADIVATGPASPDGLAKEMTWRVGGGEWGVGRGGKTTNSDHASISHTPPPPPHPPPTTQLHLHPKPPPPASPDLLLRSETRRDR